MTRVAAYMTTTPLTIGVEQTLAVARHLMTEHQIRHLPVLQGGELVGLLSKRELQSLEALPGSSRLTVEEAMVPEVYVAYHDAPLDVVAEEMARRNLGAAIVVAGSDSNEILGVFTGVDALRALADALRSQPAAVV